MYNFILFFLSALLCLGCVQTPAPIEYNYDKPHKRQTKHSIYSEKTTSEMEEEEIIERPLNIDLQEEAVGNLNTRENFDDKSEEQEHDGFKIIYHEVVENEDLEEIAKNYNQTAQEIAKLNNIKPGDAVEEFQIIKIKVPLSFLNKQNHALKDKDKISNLHKTNYIKPVEGKIITKFGVIKDGEKTNGITIQAEQGSEIQSIGDGNIIYTSSDTKFGNLIIVKLDNTEIYVAYAYMQDLYVAKGTKVKQGEVVGHVGMSGNATKPQLYFAIREKKLAVDPEKYVSYDN